MALVEIGKVAALTGEASAKSAEGVDRSLSVDSPIYQDDTITTAKGAAVELSFVDGTIFSQGANSVMLLDEYVYNQEAGTGELLFNLAKGSLRAVSGEIAKVNPEGFNVETPLSTVGIRGTTFFVLLNAAGQVVGVEAMDPTHVVEVSTNIGTTIITTQGDLVAVQLDGFISAPTQFTPQFLDSVREQLPLQDDPRNPGNDQGGQDDQGGEDGQGGQYIPDDLQEDLTGALQQLQLAGGAGEDVLGAVQGAMGDGEGTDGDGTIDTIAELQSLLTQLNEALSTITNLSNSGDDLAEDLLTTVVESVVSGFDFSQITNTDTDGSSYVSALQNAGYNLEEGDTGVNTLTGETTSKNAIFGYANNDTLTGGSNQDAIFGGSGSDVLKGGASNDYIYGGTDGDSIYGQGGADYLVGGGGSDDFYFESRTDVGDTIADFTNSVDRILLKEGTGPTEFDVANLIISVTAGYSAGTATGNTGSNIVYDPDSGKVYYDTDPTNGFNSGDGDLLICTLANKPTTLTNSDIDGY